MENYADFEIWMGTPLPGVANAGALSVQVISAAHSTGAKESYRSICKTRLF